VIGRATCYTCTAKGSANLRRNPVPSYNSSMTSSGEPENQLSKDHQRRLALINELEPFLTGGVPASSSSFTEQYTASVIVQFRSHLKSLVPLLTSRFVSEAWIIGRSMSEAIIRIKWIHRRKSYPFWILIDTELFNRNHLANVRSSQRKQTLQAIDTNIANLASNLPKTGCYWDKKRGRLRRMNKTMYQMAKECGLLSFYKSYFFFASGYTHLSHHVLGRNIVSEIKTSLTFKLDTVSDQDVYFSSRFLLALCLTLLEILEKLGYPVDRNYRIFGDEITAMADTPPSWLFGHKAAS